VLRSDYIEQDCSVSRALEVVGERWTLLIVRELLKKPCRFLELEQALVVAKNILTQRLEKMLATGLIEKHSVSASYDWSEYRLTPKGRDLFPVVNALMAWGDHYAAPDGPPLILEHSCGKAPGHKLVCEACGEDLHAHDLHIAYLRSPQPRPRAKPAAPTAVAPKSRRKGEPKAHSPRRAKP
jgi:DNA-binding HxlR family transcriptional regulator